MSDNLIVSNLDFNSVKDQFKEYMKTQSEFMDYNFEGSTLNVLFDILGYNTYMNNFYLNMVANESFIDTAVLRSSIVSKAKALNYIPRSAKSASMTVRVKIIPNNSPSVIIIPEGRIFSTSYENNTYYFVTDKSYSVSPDEQGVFIQDIELKEGNYLTHTYVYDIDNPVNFYIPNSNVDISSIKVKIKSNSTTTNVTEYSRVDDITTLNPDSTVYYLEEDINGQYRVFFGDNLLGKSLTNQNVVIIEYRTCSGTKPNQINSITINDWLAYDSANNLNRYTPSSISVTIPAIGGLDKESESSIKFNAPRNYTLQNRCVTTNDYIQFIKQNYPDIQSLNVWGGEDNVPPVYGRCFISAKPYDGYTLTLIKKNEIISQIKKRNVLSIEPIFADPTFIFVNPTVNVKYSSIATTLSADGVKNKIVQKIIDYENNDLSIFENSFKYSKFLQLIDSSDTSISSNETSVTFEKRFVPFLNSNVLYTIQFDTRIHRPFDGYTGSVSSSGFTTTLSNETSYIDDDGHGVLRLYYLSNGNRLYLNSNIGTLDYTSGKFVINGIIITDYSGDSISIYIDPENNDYVPVRNQIILISNTKITMFDTVKQEIVLTSTDIETVGNSTVSSENVSSLVV